MLTEIKVKGIVAKFNKFKTKANPPKDYTTFSVATNIYNREQKDENGYPVVEGTIWNNFIYWGSPEIEVGMPVIVTGHLTLSNKEGVPYNTTADEISLDLSRKKSITYLKGKEEA